MPSGLQVARERIRIAGDRWGGGSCGSDAGIPSPRAFSSYGWSVAGSGQGAIRESWHADHTRDEDWTSWVGGAKLSGTAASSSYGDWSLT